MLMRVFFALLVIALVSSCQTVPRSSGSWPPAGGAAASQGQVQGDVAAILRGMEQARSDGLRRAGP
jgi:hypothetical protein